MVTNCDVINTFLMACLQQGTEGEKRLRVEGKPYRYTAILSTTVRLKHAENLKPKKFLMKYLLFCSSSQHKIPFLSYEWTSSPNGLLLCQSAQSHARYFVRLEGSKPMAKSIRLCTNTLTAPETPTGLLGQGTGDLSTIGPRLSFSQGSEFSLQTLQVDQRSLSVQGWLWDATGGPPSAWGFPHAVITQEKGFFQQRRCQFQLELLVSRIAGTLKLCDPTAQPNSPKGPKHPSSVWEFTGTECPERFDISLSREIPDPCRCNCVPCALGWEQGDEPLQSLPTWPVLWFCETQNLAAPSQGMSEMAKKGLTHSWVGRELQKSLLGKDFLFWGPSQLQSVPALLPGPRPSQWCHLGEPSSAQPAFLLHTSSKQNL